MIWISFERASRADRPFALDVQEFPSRAAAASDARRRGNRRLGYIRERTGEIIDCGERL